MDKVKSKVPGYSDELPARRNLWGEVIESRQGFNDGTGEMIYNFLSPAYVTKRDPDATNNWLIDNDIGINMPKRSMKIKGLDVAAPLTAEEYNRFLELSGKPAKQKIDKLVNSGQLDRLSNDDAADAVRRVFSTTRLRAKALLLSEYPDIIERARVVNGR